MSLWILISRSCASLSDVIVDLRSDLTNFICENTLSGSHDDTGVVASTPSRICMLGKKSPSQVFKAVLRDEVTVSPEASRFIAVLNQCSSSP